MLIKLGYLQGSESYSLNLTSLSAETNWKSWMTLNTNAISDDNVIIILSF